MMADVGRPFKVWSSDRKIRKSLVAATLADLITKGKQKLNIDSTVSVHGVLERDGTRVEDEDYFDHLDNNTVFLLLKDGEHWTPEEFSSDEGEDVADAPGGWVADSSSAAPGGAANRQLRRLTSALKRDVGRLVTFTEEEQRLIAEAPTDQLQELLGVSDSETTRIQQACYRYVDELENLRETRQLMGVLHQRASQPQAESMDSLDGQMNPNKRRRSDDH